MAGMFAKVPLRAVPMAVRAAATMAARDVVGVMRLPKIVEWAPSAAPRSTQYTVKQISVSRGGWECL
ncbi:hypothetical protein MUNTM_35610 [Mycobacterium sp. MUNTM1]